MDRWKAELRTITLLVSAAKLDQMTPQGALKKLEDADAVLHRVMDEVRSNIPPPQPVKVPPEPPPVRKNLTGRG
jgi:hypothetical protein